MEGVQPMPIKCLALACSPRQNGNTAILAKHALENAGAAGCDTELLFLTDYNYGPCRACSGCDDTGVCVVEDDAKLLYDKILAADRLILAAPIFSMGICGQAKMFIDRSQKFWAMKYLLDEKVIKDSKRPERRGIYLSCAGSTHANVFAGAIQVVKYFFLMLEIKLIANLCYDDVDEIRAVLKKPAAMEEAARYGQILSEP
jgi:putative NADPH-quinone reductase